MIIADSSKDRAKGSASPTDELPPAYAPSAAALLPAASPLSPATLSHASPPSGSKPTNFVAIRQPKAITGTFVLDPALDVADAHLAPLEAGKTRETLSLASEIGAVRADVWLVSENPVNAGKKRATLRASADIGSIVLQLHNPSDTPFALSAHSSIGLLTVALPRAFRGALVLRSDLGPVRIAPALQAAITVTTTEKDAQRCFVGDAAPGGAEGPLEESEAVLRSEIGSIRVGFEGEVDLG